MGHGANKKRKQRLDAKRAEQPTDEDREIDKGWFSKVFLFFAVTASDFRMRLRFLFGLRKRRFHTGLNNFSKWTDANDISQEASKDRSETKQKALGRNQNAERTIEQIQAGGMGLILI